MEALIFILVIVALIVVHEFGHLVAAKLSGMRVDEFGIGYPPRALTLGKIGETVYTLNWIPFGGFVKIYGEDLGKVTHDPRSFSARPRILQAIVLVAGIAMNFLFAYVLITGALLAGTPRALAPEQIPLARNVALGVGQVLPDSPAAHAGLQPGDSIVSATDSKGQWNAADPESFTTFVAASKGENIGLAVKRGNDILSVSVEPQQGIAPTEPERYALGISVATIGVLPFSFAEAITKGFTLTMDIATAVATGLFHFFAGLLTFHADLSQVSGPVGIAGAVGSASASGLGDLFTLMAIISINLALINLIPIPALDGGRLLFVIIESIIRRPLNARVAVAVNGAGFALLLLLMAVVTVHDLAKLI